MAGQHLQRLLAFAGAASASAPHSPRPGPALRETWRGRRPNNTAVIRCPEGDGRGPLATAPRARAAPTPACAARGCRGFGQAGGSVSPLTSRAGRSGFVVFLAQPLDVDAGFVIAQTVVADDERWALGQRQRASAAFGGADRRGGPSFQNPQHGRKPGRVLCVVSRPGSAGCLLFTPAARCIGRRDAGQANLPGRGRRWARSA